MESILFCLRGRLPQFFTSVALLIEFQKPLFLFQHVLRVCQAFRRGQFCDFDDVPLDAIDQDGHFGRNNIFIFTVFRFHQDLCENLLILEQQLFNLAHLRDVVAVALGLF